MTGSLQTKTLSDGKEYFYIVLNFYDKHTGKRKPKWIPTKLETKGNRRKAEKLLRDELSKYDDNIYNHSSEMLFADWILHWLESIKADVELSTYEGYSLHCKHAVNYFRTRKTKLKDLKVRHFEEYYQYMLTEGKINAKTGEKSGFAIRTVRSHKFVLNAALNHAVANEIISSNPALNVRVTNKSKRQLAREIQFFTVNEANDFLNYIYEIEDTLADLIFATLYFGLRRSEVLGLTENSIDFKRHKLSINHTIVKVSTLQEKDGTKTPDSNRTYHLTEEMENFFRKVLQKKKDNEKFYGNTYHKNSYIFTWDDGRPFATDFIYHHFKRVITKYGRPNFTFHNLRHSTASMLFEKGWAPKDIQEWLGHADFYTTMNIYTHISKFHQNERAESLNGILFSANTQNVE